MQPLRRPEQSAATSRACLRLLLLAAITQPALLRAQDLADGALTGHLIPTGRPATLTLRSLVTGFTYTTPTSSSGAFTFAHIPPGDYTLLLPVGPRTVSILAGATTRLDHLTPALPEPPTTPDQDADGLLSAAGLSATQSSAGTQELPAAVDGVATTQSFTAVPAGAATDPAPDPAGDSDSAALVTGPSYGLARGRHAGSPYTFSHAAVVDSRVATRALTPESYAPQRAHPTDRSLVSLSGSTALHGLAFFTLRSSALAAAPPLSFATTYAAGVASTIPVKPHDLRTTFGGNLGGPVPHVRSLVFFYSLDLQRRGYPAISSPSDTAFFSLTAIQTALLAARGLTSAQVASGLTYLSSLTGLTPRRQDQTLHFARLDWQPRPRITLGVEYNRVRWSSPAGISDAPVVARARNSLGNSFGSIDQLLLRATLVPTPRTLHRTSLQLARDLQVETPQTPLPQEPAISPGGLAPEVLITPNGFLFGTPAGVSARAQPDERRLQLSDSLTLLRGHHQFELGLDLTLLDDRTAALPNIAGTFTYDSGVTGGRAGGLVDFLTDYTFNVNRIPNGACPSINASTHDFCFRSFAQSFGQQQVAFATQRWAGFAQDSFRPRAGLTLLAGLRYDYTLLPLPQQPNAALDAIFSTRAATGIFPEDRNNFGPRAALAWEPLGPGRGTLRAGFGLFYGTLPGATIRSALAATALPSSTTRIRITPSTVTDCPQVAAQGFGYPCAFIAQPTGVAAATSSAVVFDRHFRLPLIQQGSLTLERTLPRDLTLSAGYLFNLDRQLPGSTDINIAPSTRTATYQLTGGTGASGVRSGQTFVLPLYTARVTPTFGPVTDILSNVNATYHALVVTASGRPIRTLRMQAAYTWSRAIDLGQALSATPRTDGQLDPFTNAYDKGLSSQNYPWILRASALWQPAPPAFAAPLWLTRSLSRWELAPVFLARAGRPYSYTLSGGTRLSGGHESLNGSGGALYLPTVGRNTLRLPPAVNVDLRVDRTFAPSSRLRLRASAQAANLFNHINVSSVVQRAYLVGTQSNGIIPLTFQDAATIAAEGLNTQPFGAVNAASSSLLRERHVELALHLEF